MTLEMIKLEEKEAGVQQGIAIGEKNGERNAKIETARSMKKDGMAIDKISLYTGLSLDEVKQLSTKEN